MLRSKSHPGDGIVDVEPIFRRGPVVTSVSGILWASWIASRILRPVSTCQSVNGSASVPSNSIPMAHGFAPFAWLHRTAVS